MASTSPGNWACWSTLAKNSCEEGEEAKGGTTQVPKLSESSGEGEGRKDGNNELSSMPVLLETSFQDT